MRRVLSAAAKKTFLEARVKVPSPVSVEKNAEVLTISGPLGLIRTDLSKLDTQGSTAIKLLPDNREIAIASCSKPFFGTIQSLLKNKIQVNFKRSMICRRTNTAGGALLLTHISVGLTKQCFCCAGSDARVLEVPQNSGHWVQSGTQRPDLDIQTGLQS